MQASRRDDPAPAVRVPTLDFATVRSSFLSAAPLPVSVAIAAPFSIAVAGAISIYPPIAVSFPVASSPLAPAHAVIGALFFPTPGAMMLCC